MIQAADDKGGYTLPPGGRLLRTLSAILVTILLVLSAPAEAAERTLSASERYELGLKFMRRGYFTKALEEFNRVRNYHRDDPVSVKAALAIADVHFKKGDYDQARYAYEEFAAYHPRHETIDYVTFQIGLSIYKRAPKLAGRDQSATRGAVNVWTGFERRFPTSIYKEEAQKYLARSRERLAAKELYVAHFYRRRGAWRAVQDRSRLMMRRYPSSERLHEALYLLALSEHAWGNPTEARQIADRLSTDHPASTYQKKLEKALSKPPGTPPEDALFVRPYRIRGVGTPTQ